MCLLISVYVYLKHLLTFLNLLYFVICLLLRCSNSLWRRKWQATPVFLPRESCEQRSLVGYCPQGCTESDTTDVTACMRALEKEMATHSSVLAWRIPGTGAWWAAISGVAQSQTRLQRLSSSSNSLCILGYQLHVLQTFISWSGICLFIFLAVIFERS